MTERLHVVVGGSIEEDLSAFAETWERLEKGAPVDPQRVFAFENWEALSATLSGERWRLLRHLHRNPEVTVSALARALGRQYSRVHADVMILEGAGLLDRSGNMLRPTADRITADLVL